MNLVHSIANSNGATLQNACRHCKSILGATIPLDWVLPACSGRTVVSLLMNPWKLGRTQLWMGPPRFTHFFSFLLCVDCCCRSRGCCCWGVCAVLLLFWFLVALFIVVEVVLWSFFAKMEALKGHYIILNQMCFDETGSSCIVAMSLSQKAYCCHVVPNQWGSWSKNSKLISEQAALVGAQYDFWCLLKSRKNYLNECRQDLNVFSSPSFSNHVWQMSQSSLVSLTTWHLPNVSACRTLPSPLIFVGAFPASGRPVRFYSCIGFWDFKLLPTGGKCSTSSKLFRGSRHQSMLNPGSNYLLSVLGLGARKYQPIPGKSSSMNDSGKGILALGSKCKCNTGQMYMWVHVGGNVHVIQGMVGG